MKIKCFSIVLPLLLAVAGTPVVTAAPAQSSTIDKSTKVTVAVRRLNESEYRHSIADILGPDIEIAARFEPEVREGGLLAIGNSTLTLTSAGFEQYFNLARAIGDQLFAKENIDELVGCKVKDQKSFNDKCATKFIAEYGEKIFRRPLTQSEIEARVATVKDGTKQAKDFAKGLNLALVSLLVAPDYLFRVEKAEPDPNNPGEYRLDAYTKASRLSFMLWNTTPDAALLAAAKNGELHSERGLKKQLDRLVESPRFSQGARAFFADMLQLEGFENMVKDSTIYPKFNQTIADSAREQMLKTAVGLLVEQDRDYRDLFSSNDTYINRPLASIYKVPYTSKQEWTPYTFPEELERAGILTQVGFLSLFAHPGTSSPTRRGIKIHEIFMCEPTPDPPADVDFSAVKDSMANTVRGRLLDHLTNEGCTACHQRSDPPGLALEHFDGIGQLRKYENGMLIDVSADFNGVNLIGAEGLAGYLHDDKRVPACLVRNVYAYGTGQDTDFFDEDYLYDQTEKFAAQGYRLTNLVKQIALTPEFFAVEIPEGLTLEASAENTTAQVQ